MPLNFIFFNYGHKAAAVAAVAAVAGQRQHLDTMLLLDIAVVVVVSVTVVEVFEWCGFSILPFHNECKSFVFCVLNLLA